MLQESWPRRAATNVQGVSRMELVVTEHRLSQVVRRLVEEIECLHLPGVQLTECIVDTGGPQW